MTVPPVEDAKLSPAEQRRVTIWRIIGAIYVRVQAKAEGRTPGTLTDDDRRMILDLWSEAMAHDFRLICDVMEQARLAGVEDTHSTLQRIEAQDPETLDEAAAWAREVAREEERERALDQRDAEIDARERRRT